MQIKLLILPTLIILSFIIGVGFIKPDLDTLKQKKASLKQKQDQVATIDTVKANVEALHANLEKNVDLETFVTRYYPDSMDQERIIDSFNFMATQSGVVIEAMEMKEVITPQAEASLGVGGPLTSVAAQADNVGGTLVAADGSTTTEGTPMIPLFQAPKPSLYVSRVQVKGGYDNIKSFLNRLSRMDRTNNLLLMSISTDKKPTEETEGGSSSNQLIGTFEAQFGYISAPKNENAVGVAVFWQNALGEEKIKEVQEWSNALVPPLTVTESGKANPFQ